MTGSMIWYDFTQRSVVVGCSCGARDVFTCSQAAGGWAARHLMVAHPDPAPSRRLAISASLRRDTPQT